MMREFTFKMSTTDVARLRHALYIARGSFQDSVDFVNKYPDLSTSAASYIHEEDLKIVDLLNGLIDLLLDPNYVLDQDDESLDHAANVAFEAQGDDDGLPW
jgi:hypothetical protein